MNKLNPHMTPSPGMEPGQHWWKVSALTTAPSLLFITLPSFHIFLIKLNAVAIVTVLTDTPNVSRNKTVHLLGFEFYCETSL